MKPTRRRFLQSAISSPLAVALGDGLLHHLALITPARAQARFEYGHIIRFDPHCFILRGLDTLIYSAAFHYPRCPRALWRDRLGKLRRAGFNTIETYVFWNYHEPKEGSADLSEFEQFIQLVDAMDFWMIARPGPYICAEWDRGGIPHWVAAKRFPLRSNHAENVKASQHWFDLVLPVIERHQVTSGGPILAVQIENEYDYHQLPEEEKREYLRALAQMAWRAGIDVPLLTCWTKQARDGLDRDMARITDTCNFYPRWNVARQVPPALKKLREEEPLDPLGVLELQGGWFSQFGGKLPVEQEDVGPAQFDLVTKTVLEHGVTFLNVYMAFGGTNFDWASKTLTTTYDYAAPLREPGGLWEKYYAARGIGQTLSLVAPILARSEALEGVPKSSNPEVTITERVKDQSGMVFLRENSGREQRVKIGFRDPNSPTERTISVPREGELVLGPREAKILPVQVRVTGLVLRYTTAEVFTHGLIVDRSYLVVYDRPGRLIEIGLATSREPLVQGGGDEYIYYDEAYESVIIGVRVEEKEKIFLVNNHLLLVVSPRDRAQRTWTAEFPTKVVPGAEEPKPMAVPFLSDAYQLAGSGAEKRRIWADLEFQPGEHAVTALVPPVPKKCSVDGIPHPVEYERMYRTARVKVMTPDVPVASQAPNQVQTWTEQFDPAAGTWTEGPLRPLEEFGPPPYGYVKYRAEFEWDGESVLLLSTFANDMKHVFINGKHAAEAANHSRRVEIPLTAYAVRGQNTLEVAYEAFGAPHFGPNVGELKGLESARLVKPSGESRPIEGWRLQRFAVPMRGRELDPAYLTKAWPAVALAEVSPDATLVPAFTWCRAEFALPGVPSEWTVPRKLTFEAARDALLFLNGKFLGRYVTVGPQKDFYLPETMLNFDPRQKNVLTFVLAYAPHAQFVRTLRVGHYEEFSVRRTRIEFEW